MTGREIVNQQYKQIREKGLLEFPNSDQETKLKTLREICAIFGREIEEVNGVPEGYETWKRDGHGFTYIREHMLGKKDIFLVRIGKAWILFRLVPKQKTIMFDLYVEGKLESGASDFYLSEFIDILLRTVQDHAIKPPQPTANDQPNTGGQTESWFRKALNLLLP